jgi:hypothetical protein
MKLNLNPSKFLGEAAVTRVESLTRPGKYHYVMKLRDGGVICSCEGYQYNSHCKHLDNLPTEEILGVMKRWRRER